MDRTVRVFRLDTFQLLQVVDTAHMVLGVRCLPGYGAACWTTESLQVYRLTSYARLFSMLDTGIRRIALCEPPNDQQMPQISVQCEDGSFRLLSPLTGATLTLTLPVPLLERVHSDSYELSERTLYVTTPDGCVVAMDASVNPCRPVGIYFPCNIGDRCTAVLAVHSFDVLAARDDNVSRHSGAFQVLRHRNEGMGEPSDHRKICNMLYVQYSGSPTEGAQPNHFSIL